MPEVPSLLNLCIDVIKNQILDGEEVVPYLYKLPSDLFDSLLPRLPPLALQRLQEKLPSDIFDGYEFADEYFKKSRKRKRYENFNAAWKALYKSRWPDSQSHSVAWISKYDKNHEAMNDWQQIYWETHLQSCLDTAAGIVSCPSFEGCLGEIKISDSLVECTGYEQHQSSSTNDSNLAYHCQQFGLHARSLRLQNVLCIAEISNFLRTCKLQRLELHWIKSKEQVEGLCKLLNQNCQTLTSLDFAHCKLSPDFVNAICDSLHVKGLQAHGIHHFAIKRSSFLETNTSSLPVGLESFISSARSLSSLILCDNNLGRKIAKMVFNALLDASSSIASLDLSENNIAGWLSQFKWRPSSSSQLSLGIGKSLQSLRVLNLRSNNLCKKDAACLRYALVYVPNLEVFDLSDNPIGDDGIRNLMPYFHEISERQTPFARLDMEKCELSLHGISELLGVLSSLKEPIKSLSIGDNLLGSKAGILLGKFLRTGIQALDVKGIGLGPSGFIEARKEFTEQLKLVHINISDNSGGIETANFLSELISRAPELVAVNAGFNSLPLESVPIICSCLKEKGKLDHLDLTGNYICNQPATAALLAEFQANGKPVVVLPPLLASDSLYDNDP